MKKIYILFTFCLLAAISLHAQEIGIMQHMLIPDGDVTLAGKTKGLITKEQLLKEGQLHLRQSDTSKYQIKSFELVIVPHNKKAKEKTFESKNAELTQDMLDAISQGSNGDKLYFQSIRSVDKNEAYFHCDPITFKLKVTPVDSSLAKSPTIAPLNTTAGTDQSH